MTSKGGHTVACDDLPWLPLAPKVSVKVIKTVPETGAFSVMIRAEAGGVLPRHKHLDSAEIYIFKGSGEHMQTGAYKPGDYISEPKDAIHDPLHFVEDTELLMVCQGPSAFIDDNDQTLYLMDVAMLQQLQGRAEAATAG